MCPLPQNIGYATAPCSTCCIVACIMYVRTAQVTVEASEGLLYECMSHSICAIMEHLTGAHIALCTAYYIDGLHVKNVAVEPWTCTRVHIGDTLFVCRPLQNTLCRNGAVLVHSLEHPRHHSTTNIKAAPVQNGCMHDSAYFPYKALPTELRLEPELILCQLGLHSSQFTGCHVVQLM